MKVRTLGCLWWLPPSAKPRRRRTLVVRAALIALALAASSASAQGDRTGKCHVATDLLLAQAGTCCDPGLCSSKQGECLSACDRQYPMDRQPGRRDSSRVCDKRVDEGSTIVVVNDVQFRRDGDLLLFRIGASHVLWKMVRRVVGALVEVGRGSIDAAEFARLLEARSGTGSSSEFDVAAHTAPPSGLFLERVGYRDGDHPGELVPVFPVSRH